MLIDESTLNKGQLRKLNALRKSVGEILGEQTFSKWLKKQSTASSVAKHDIVADKILEAVSSLAKDKSIKLGNKGYFVRRAKGVGAKGFIVGKIV